MDDFTFARPKAVSVVVGRWNARLTVIDAEGVTHEYAIRVDMGDGMYMDEEKPNDNPA